MDHHLQWFIGKHSHQRFHGARSEAVSGPALIEGSDGRFLLGLLCAGVVAVDCTGMRDNHPGRWDLTCIFAQVLYDTKVRGSTSCS